MKYYKSELNLQICIKFKKENKKNISYLGDIPHYKSSQIGLDKISDIIFLI